jgi:L-rhamnose mutarotase
MAKKRFILFCDLQDHEDMIQAYETYHVKIPEAIETSILEAGILSMEIFRAGNRLVMEIVAKEEFNFELKSKMDQENPEVIAWETLMSTFQKPIPIAQENEKWVLGKQIFKL